MNNPTPTPAVSQSTPAVMHIRPTPRLRVGAIASLRESYTGHVTGSSNPSIGNGARVEIQDLHWGNGICWASIVVLESKDPDQVGCVAVLPVGRLKVEIGS